MKSAILYSLVAALAVAADQKVLNAPSVDGSQTPVVPVNVPKPLHASESEAVGLDTLGSLGEALKALGASMHGIEPETADLWAEMQQDFGDVVDQLTFVSKPKPATPRDAKDYDFHVTASNLPGYSVRVKKPSDLGVDKVKQYSGYLDIEEEDKHFFYWFFESRNDPKNDPIVLWLNGGPGCSSMTGLFFELGPSSIKEDGSLKYNPYSWNNNASIIFLDQPVNVGYSYSSQSVSSTVAAGKDVYAFLSLFFKQFPEYAELDFHMAGESYAGHYIPVFAAEILSHKNRNFNLTSVMIGNGLTDGLTQYKYYEPMACGKGGAESVLSEEECAKMESSYPRCSSMIQSCYNSESVWSCVPASIYCNNAMMGPYQKTGKNVYDIRTSCEDSANLCYPQMGWISSFLNNATVKAAVGAEVDNFESCNFDINRNFLFNGDWMKPYHFAVPHILESGVPVLIYAGDKDFICNWLGNQAWTNALEWSGASAFQKAETSDWVVGDKQFGTVQSANNFTFLRVFEAGHMTPYDQPEASLAFFNNWISGNYNFA
ncbi:Alpha/Beta hydrolase protein [Dipodascopsis uninucleata]